MNRVLLFVTFITFAALASAATLTVNCTSPGVDANPPAAGTISPVSTCGTGIVPGGNTVTFVALDALYSISLQIGGSTGTATFSHLTNVDSAFDNVVGTSVTNPSLFVTGASVACPSVACTSALAALAAGSATITTSFSDAALQTSTVSGDYQWRVTYQPDDPGVPEPATFALLGLGLFVLGIRRLKR